jgi:hypothetical protein
MRVRIALLLGVAALGAGPRPLLAQEQPPAPAEPIARPSTPGVKFIPPVSPDPVRHKRRVAGMRRLEEAYPRALELLRRRLGTRDLGLPPVFVGVSEVGAEFGELEPDTRADASLHPRDSGWVGLIRVSPSVVEFPAFDDERLLAHELGHLLHLHGTGDVPAPAWLAEGLAHWLEAEDEQRLRELVLDRANNNPEKPRIAVSTLFQHPESLAKADEESQRVCGAVILHQLERSRGIEAHRRLVGRLLEDPDHEKVLKEETGLGMADLLARVRTGYLEWAGLVFAGKDELTRASLLAKDEKYEEALGVVDGLLKEDLEPNLRATVELLRTLILLESRDLPRARASLEPIRALRRTRPRALLVPLGVETELKVLRACEDWQAVADFCRELLDSRWQDDPEFHAVVEEALAAARSHLPTPPISTEPGK